MTQSIENNLLDKSKYKKGNKISYKKLKKGNLYFNSFTGDIIVFIKLKNGFVIDEMGYINCTKTYFEAILKTH